MITVSTAPTRARKLAKSAIWRRETFHRASKDTEAGAPDRLPELLADFQADNEAAERAIRATRTIGADAARAALILRTGGALAPTGPISRKAHALALLRPDSGSLMAMLEHVSSRAAEAVDRAEARLDGGVDLQLRATALLGVYLLALGKADFNKSDSRLAAPRQMYQDAIRAARKEDKHA